jgi:phosphatidylinositol phospholipase C delta
MSLVTPSQSFTTGGSFLRVAPFSDSPVSTNIFPSTNHSHTMTSKILFEDIIKSFQVFLMMHPMTYPIILSLENHCSFPFQQVMAGQLRSILGKNLYIPDEQSLLGDLPSPSQ